MSFGVWWVVLGHDGVTTITHTFNRSQYRATFKSNREALDTMVERQFLLANTESNIYRRLEEQTGTGITFSLRDTLTPEDFEAAGFSRHHAP